MENAALFRVIIERGFNQGDVSVADEVCAAKLIESGSPYYVECVRL
jgi:hypothetical protein